MSGSEHVPCSATALGKAVSARSYRLSPTSEKRTRGGWLRFAGDVVTAQGLAVSTPLSRNIPAPLIIRTALDLEDEVELSKL